MIIKRVQLERITVHLELSSKELDDSTVSHVAPPNSTMVMGHATGIFLFIKGMSSWSHIVDHKHLDCNSVTVLFYSSHK